MSVSVRFLICSWLSQWGGCAAPSQTVIPPLIRSKTAGVSWGDVPARKARPLAKEEGLWESRLLYTPGTFLIRAPSQEGVWSLGGGEPADLLPAVLGTVAPSVPCAWAGAAAFSGQEVVSPASLPCSSGKATPERGKKSQFVVDASQIQKFLSP